MSIQNHTSGQLAWLLLDSDNLEEELKTVNVWAIRASPPQTVRRKTPLFHAVALK
jgi:hypothetical protein